MHEPKVCFFTLGSATAISQLRLQAFGRERISWRAVIFLNIVHSFHLIMNAMERAQRRTLPLEGDENEDLRELPRLSADLLKTKRRLSPLLQVEDALINQISPVYPVGRDETGLTRRPSKASLKEIAVNSATQWKESFGRLVKGSRITCEEDIDWDDPNDPGRLLHACSEDMIRLWHDPVIQELLHRLKIRMEDHAGLYALGFSPFSELVAHLSLLASWILLNASQRHDIFPLTVGET